MQTSLCLDLADARQLIAAAQSEAEQRSARVTIAICDSGGHLLVLERRDGASCSSAETAAAKARMAALDETPEQRAQRPCRVMSWASTWKARRSAISCSARSTASSSIGSGYQLRDTTQSGRGLGPRMGLLATALQDT